MSYVRMASGVLAGAAMAMGGHSALAISFLMPDGRAYFSTQAESDAARERWAKVFADKCGSMSRAPTAEVKACSDREVKRHLEAEADAGRLPVLKTPEVCLASVSKGNMPEGNPECETTTRKSLQK